MSIRDIRGAGQEPPPRPVVQVGSIVDTPKEPPITSDPAPQKEEEPKEQSPITVENEFDLNALLSYLPDDDEKLLEEGEKLTYYLNEKQYDKLLLICRTYSTRGKDLPENYQHVLRYVLDEMPLEAFAGMPAYVRQKKMERLKAMSQRRLEKFLRGLKAKSRKIMGE